MTHGLLLHTNSDSLVVDADENVVPVEAMDELVGEKVVGMAVVGEAVVGTAVVGAAVVGMVSHSATDAAPVPAVSVPGGHGSQRATPAMTSTTCTIYAYKFEQYHIKRITSACRNNSLALI